MQMALPSIITLSPYDPITLGDAPAAINAARSSFVHGRGRLSSGSNRTMTASLSVTSSPAALRIVSLVPALALPRLVNQQETVTGPSLRVSSRR